MTQEWEVSSATESAQMQATLVLLNTGSGSARIVTYTTVRPGSINEPHSHVPQATIELAVPAGEVIAGVLHLYPKDAQGALVMHPGIPRWGDLISRSGVIVARATVTDVDHGGGFRVMGGDTPEGDDSPLLYAGSKVQLGAVSLT